MKRFRDAVRGVAGPLAELLSGAAYRPRAADATVPLAERLAGCAVLVLAVARDRAATLRVRFEDGQARKLGESRQFALREKGDLARALAAEADAAGAEWVVVVMTLGWQAQIASRTARQPGEDAFERFRLLRDEPEFLVSQAKPDHVYAAVDHPVLDRSVVFSCRRKEVDEVLAEVREAGLGVAAVRLGVASQLEHWMAGHREHSLESDLLITDGMSVLLVNAYDGDLLTVGRQGREGNPVPRQASSRPAEVPRDMARFLKDNGDRPVRYLGPGELLETLGAAQPCPLEAETGDAMATDAVMAALSGLVAHDLNPGLKAERRALPHAWRRWIWTGLAAEVALAVALVAGSCAAVGARFDADAARRALRESEGQMAALRLESEGMRTQLGQAEEMRSWIGTNYHAQRLMTRILENLPPGVALESVSARLDESSPQMSLEFVLLGGDDAQIATTRALERAVLGLDFQIGERAAPIQGGRGRSYRWRLIMPVMTGGGGKA